MTKRESEGLRKIEMMIDINKSAMEKFEKKGWDEEAGWVRAYVFGIEAAASVMKNTFDKEGELK